MRKLSGKLRQGVPSPRPSTLLPTWQNNDQSQGLTNFSTKNKEQIIVDKRD